MIRRIVCAAAFTCVATTASAQAAAKAVKPGPEHKRLEQFVGTWSYEGDAKASPWSPAGKVTGTDVFEMLPGGFFLQHKWEEKNPIGTIKGVEIWAYDAEKKSYTYNFYSSAGESGSGTLTNTGNVWHSSGSGIAYDGKRGWGRCTATFANPTVFSWKCEASQDGKAFASSFDGKWTKK